MTFRLRDSWVWDFWLADDGRHHHLFYLHAPKSLGDPHLRHRNARIGHAVSDDLREWNDLGTVLEPDDPGAFDATATWTGSVVRGPDGAWRMFYTGARFEHDHNIQAIGVATSPDLHVWTKQRDCVITPGDQWYERYGDSSWPEEAWRDPWVFPDPSGEGWHMLITARANTGPDDDRGVLGHARSTDLLRWTVLPPLTDPGAGFAHLEVPQVEQVDGRTTLLFSADTGSLSARRRAAGSTGGIWSVDAENPLGPFDLSGAAVISTESLYSGRIVRDRSGNRVLLAFVDKDASGGFVGEITDPLPLARVSPVRRPGPEGLSITRPGL